jgi:large subunit ribosomal protein L33
VIKLYGEVVIMPRDLVKLVCSECGEENYYTDKNKKTTPEKLELKKYCKVCRKATIHKEKK